MAKTLKLFRARNGNGCILAVIGAENEQMVWAYCSGAKLPIHSVDEVEMTGEQPFVVVIEMVEKTYRHPERIGLVNVLVSC